MENFALSKAVKVVGGQVKLAAAIRLKNGSKVEQQHVWKWLNRCTSPMPPAEYVLAIEAATKEKGQIVSRYELRPDIYPIDENK